VGCPEFDHHASRRSAVLAARVLALAVLFVISISAANAVQGAPAAPTGDEIAAKVAEKLKEIQTVQADIVASFSDSSSKNPINMTIRVSADRSSNITRMEITQHQVFEGQIVILDMKKDITTVYMPVTGQAYRGRSATIAAQLGLDMGSFDLDNLLSMDPAGMMTFKYLRQDKFDRLPHHVVQTRPKMDVEGYQLVWVDCETLMVRKVEAFDGQGKLTASITINNLKVNLKLNTIKLRELPKGTRITDVK
jgi:outer membrane lipoprotein-sorting protein